MVKIICKDILLIKKAKPTPLRSSRIADIAEISEELKNTLPK